MKQFIKPILAIVDHLTEELLHMIRKGNIHILSKYRKGEYENIAINSMLVYESYESIRKMILRSKSNSLTVIDFGSGIGNVLALFSKFSDQDKKVFPCMKRKNLYGIEKISEYREKSIAGKISNIDLMNLTEVADFIDWTVDNTTNIWYCNRPFKDLELQHKLEMLLVEKAPKGTFLINPMGFTLNFRNFNVKVINKTLIVKK